MPEDGAIPKTSSAAASPGGRTAGAPECANALAASGSRVSWLFLLVFLLLAVGITATGYLYYRSYERNYRTEVERQLSAIADLKVGELAQWRKERLADAGVLFKNAAISDLVRRVLENPEDADAPRQLQMWFGQYRTHLYYDGVRLLDAQGVNRLAVPAGAAPSSATLVQGAAAVLRSGQVAMLDFYRNDDDQRIYLAVLVPILDAPEANRPLGVVVLQIDPATYLYPLIQRWPTPSRTAETLLVRKDGNEALFLNELKFQTNTALTLRFPLDRVMLPAAQAALGQEGIMEGIDYRGMQVVAALRTIPGTPWALVARMDTAEVLAPLRTQLWQVVVLICVLLFGAGAGVGLVWHQQRGRIYREQAESAEVLRVEKQNLDAILNASPIPLFILDETTRIVRVNTAALVLTGGPASAALERRPGNALGCVHSADDPRGCGYAPACPLCPARNGIEALLASGGVLQGAELMLELVRAGAPQQVWVNIGAAPVQLNGRRHLCVAMEDITERKRVAEKLRLKNYVFDASIAASSIADTTGVITEANDAFLKVWGYPNKEEVVGRPIPDFIQNQDDGAAILAALSTTGAWEGDYTAKRKDGTTFAAHSLATVIRDERGKVIGSQSAVQDITERKRAEAALSASEAKYRRLHESMMDSFCRVNMAGVLQDFNPAYQTLVGYNEDEIKRLTYNDLTPEKWHAEETRIVSEQVLARGYSDVYEKEYRRKDGTIVPIELRTMLLRDADNRPAGMWAIIRDISARKQTEEVLRHQQELLIETGRIAQVGGWVFDTATGQGTWTEEVARIHDLEPTDETNMALGLSFYTGESRARIEAAIKEAVVSSRSYDLILELTTARQNHKWVRTIGHPHVENGTVVKISGSFQDITELKKAEEALRITQHLLTETEKMGKVGGWEFDVETGRQIWTDEMYRIHELDFTFDPTVQKAVNFSAPASRPAIDRAVQRAVALGESFDLELQIITAKGNLREVHAIGKADPARRKVFGFFQDITERKRAENEVLRLNADLEQRVRDRTVDLDTANKELEAFSYSVSHDLRTPLRAMDGFSMALLEDYAGQLDETAQNYLRRIRAGSQRMAGLIDDLLNLSHLTRETMRRECVDLTLMAKEMGAEFQQMNPERVVEWCVAPALTADADKGMLRAALGNLLGNAWKFTGRCVRARIEVGARERGGERVFFVRDNGAGFDMAYAGRLFGAFQRLHSLQEFPGNGIGLALVQRIVRRHGGRVWAEGAVGQGATFYFTLGTEAKGGRLAEQTLNL
jgi:PAS domain S-box-containing protein